jgi:hypothetical protein
MHGSSGLDIRLPIGGLFTILGLMLAGYGFATAGDPDRYARSLGLNVNLLWGLVMLLFGLVLLSAATHAKRSAAAHPASETVEGRAIEEREHGTGLER